MIEFITNLMGSGYEYRHVVDGGDFQFSKQRQKLLVLVWVSGLQGHHRQLQRSHRRGQSTCCGHGGIPFRYGPPAGHPIYQHQRIQVMVKKVIGDIHDGYTVA